MTYLAKIHINYKKSILNPEAQAVHKAIKHLGYDDVKNVKMGKYFELRLSSKNFKQADSEINEICDKLLANVNMESYHYQILKKEEIK